MIKLSGIVVIFITIAISSSLLAERNGLIPAAAKAIADRISTERMRADVKFLSSDLLEGRGTGQRGGDIAAAYIATQLELLGLKPLGDHGTFKQKIPLMGLTTLPESTVSFSDKNGEKRDLKFLEDFVANALSLQSEETISAPVVFVGYGVKAPEFEWDDYAGVDVKGKVVLALVNDPPSMDPKFFAGRAMTYYGRWTYKYEEAARQQASGILLIHNTEMASYGWNVVRNSWSGEQAYLENPEGSYALRLAGWITEAAGTKLFSAAGLQLAEAIKKAGQKGFQPEELPLQMNARLIAKIRPLHAENVIGMLEGAQTKDEAVLYSAHYDHLGIGNPVDGDNIYNGAQDNASGTALLLELARVYAGSTIRPARSIIFLAVTGEERGLRGSEYFGKNPAIPAKNILVNLNYDGIEGWGETANVVLTGADRTTVWPIVEETASALNLRISPEAHPEAGYYYRSDHFSLARVGVPAFSLDLGDEILGKPKEYSEKKYKEYRSKRYHQPSDEFYPEWDFSGARQLARLGVYIGWKVTELKGTTGWKPGDEFEKMRTP